MTLLSSAPLEGLEITALPMVSLGARMEGLEGADLEQIERQADRATSRRSLSVTLAFPIASLLVGLSSSYGSDHPLLVAVLTGGSLLVAAARGYLRWRFDKLYASHPRRWRALFVAASAAAALLWSTLSSLVFWFYGFGGISFLALLITTVLCVAATIDLARSLRWVNGFAILMLGPHIGVGLFSGRAEGAWVAAVLSAFLVYVSVAGRRHQQDLWEGLAQTRRLEIRVAELEKMRARAEAARDSRGAFLANMSHEIRTPLGGVLGMSELLLTSDDPQTSRQYSQVIHSSAQSLLTLVDDILDFSKIEAGELEISAIDFSLHRTVHEVAKLLKPRAIDKDIGLELNLAEGLPDWLVGDPFRLRQVLINLIGNAIKFTAEGQVVLEADSESRNGRLWVRFAIHDTGIGIEKEAQQRLFAAYAQGDSSISRRFGGTGLGLSICLNIVSMQEGEIGFESASGVGSTFWFQIPYAPSLLPAKDRAADPEQKPSMAEIRLRELQVCRVLLVEDNEAIHLFARKVFESLAIRADVAGNGAEALATLQSQDYDLVLMDCEMPVLDGYETTRQIRKWEAGARRTPIVALTANALVEDREKCLSVGMDDYLAKPFSKRSLVEILDRWLPTPRPANLAADDEATSPPPVPFDGGSGKLDPERIASLRELGSDGVDVFAEIARVFRDRVHRMLPELRQGFVVRDATAVRLCAHSFNGGASNLGAQRLAELSREIELLAHQDVIFEYPDKLNELEAEFERVELELDRLIQQP